MARLVSNPQRKNNVNKSMSKEQPYRVDEISASISRGNLLRYAMYVEDVNKNLKSLKQSNPKYLELMLKVIECSLTELQAKDVSVPLDKILQQWNEVSYSNHELLDFTSKVIESVDTLTAKCYLAFVADNLSSFKDLKNHCKAAVPFVKYIVSAVSKEKGLARQILFINAIQVLINKKADFRKIELLPKIKYLADTSKKDCIIDVPSIVFGKLQPEEILNNFKQTAEVI